MDIGERIILKLTVLGNGWAGKLKQQIKEWAAAGLDEKTILEKLETDFAPGGRTFEAIVKAFGNATGEAVDYVAVEQVHEEWGGVDRWTWVSNNDANRCEDCAKLDGEVATWDEWEAMGLPGMGATVCGWRCRCTLEPG